MIKKAWFVVAVLAVAALAWVLLAGAHSSPPPKPAQQTVQKAQHPGYPENKDELEATTCRECHSQVTPEIYKEWAQSKHGVDNVRCFVCHGDFKNFKKTPSVETCRGCHAKQYSQIMLPTGKSDKTCWSCHPAHRLTVHKSYSTKPSPLY